MVIVQKMSEVSDEFVRFEVDQTKSYERNIYTRDRAPTAPSLRVVNAE